MKRSPWLKEKTGSTGLELTGPLYTGSVWGQLERDAVNCRNPEKAIWFMQLTLFALCFKALGNWAAAWAYMLEGGWQMTPSLSWQSHHSGQRLPQGFLDCCLPTWGWKSGEQLGFWRVQAQQQGTLEAWLYTEHCGGTVLLQRTLGADASCAAETCPRYACWVLDGSSVGVISFDVGKERRSSLLLCHLRVAFSLASTWILDSECGDTASQWGPWGIYSSQMHAQHGLWGEKGCTLC